MASFNNGDNYLTIRNLLNSTGLRKNNFSGGSAPGVSDDSSAGYEIGSLWLDTGNSVMYFAEDVSSGAASWVEVGTGAVTSSNYGDANVISLLSDIGSNTITTTGTITAGAFVGDGSGLTSLPSGAAQQLTWDSANSNLSISGGNTVTMFDQTLDSTDTVTFNQVNTPTLTTVENIYGPVAGTLLLDAGATAYVSLSTAGSGVTVSSADGININNTGSGTINIGHSTNQTNFAGTVNFTSSTVTGIYDQSLNTTDDVEFNQVTAANVITTGVGAPVFDSASTITFDAPDGVIVQTGPLRLPNLTTTERNALTASNGDMIYNTTDSKLQGYQNGSWINLDGT